MEKAIDVVDMDAVRADIQEARGHGYRRQYAARKCVAHLEALLRMVEEIEALGRAEPLPAQVG